MPVSVADIRKGILDVIGEDIESRKKVFQKFDITGDGLVTKEDCEHVGKYLGLAGQYDEDGDGTITKDEYMTKSIMSLLKKKFDLDSHDNTGAMGYIELHDFRRCLETEARMVLNPADDGALLTILAAVNPNPTETGVDYKAFVVLLQDMCTIPDYYFDDDAVKGFLKECEKKLPLTEDKIKEMEAEFKAMDIDSNGSINQKDAAGVKEVIAKYLEKLETDSRQDWLTKSEFKLFHVLKSYDELMTKAVNSVPERVTKETFLRVLSEAGVSDDASATAVYNKMPAIEFSVKTEDFNKFLADFVQGKVLT